MPPKSEADHIYLLLSIIEHVDGKIKWDEVSKVTGLYKEGRFVRQAYNSIKKKYGGNGSAAAADGGSSGEAGKKAAPKTPARKRAKADEDVPVSSKKPKTKVDKNSDEDELAQENEVDGEVA